MAREVGYHEAREKVAVAARQSLQPPSGAVFEVAGVQPLSATFRCLPWSVAGFEVAAGVAVPLPVAAVPLLDHGVTMAGHCWIWGALVSRWSR